LEREKSTTGKFGRERKERAFTKERSAEARGAEKFSAEKFSAKKRSAEKFSAEKSSAEKSSAEKFSGEKKNPAKSENKPTPTRSRTAVGRGPSSTSASSIAKASTAAKARTYTETTTVLRLNKFLADSGICSRRQADEYIQKGVVKVKGKVVTELGTKVHLSDLVTVNGEPVNAEKHLTYVVLNKPKDYITTTNDEKGRKTVMELIPLHHRIYPIGRLDRATTGVLLLTNDGELAYRLMHPSYGVSRIYTAHLDKRLSLGDMNRIARGVKIQDEDGNEYVSGECNVAIDPEEPRMVTLELAEGKNREVRRIFDALGYEVERLDRKGYAGISTRGLRRGEYRHLATSEVRALETLVKLDRRLEDATTAQRVRSKSRHSA
jgi:23S rRNA pseudouridine2605 synthase